MEDQALGLMRDEVGGIFLGSVFLFIGMAACGVAAIRRSGVHLLLWQGIFSALYGARILVAVPASFHVLPRFAWPSQNYLIWIITYLIPLPALLFWLELSRGKLRPFLRVAIVATLANAVAGFSSTLISGSPSRFMGLNNVLGIWIVLSITTVIVVPSLARRYLTFQSQIAAIGVSIFAVAALYQNLKDLLHLREYPFLEPLGFAAAIFSLGYVAAEKVFTDERRLQAIEKELEIAREIQHSILPRNIPELKNLRIAAAYHPMTAVAGDFYDFIPVDQHHLGVLVADVSGHGVPAALIAAMLKMAVQSVVPCVRSPGDVLQGLNRMLSGQAPDQFVTAAYLFIDTQNYKARYSAAGHPPLLLLRAGTLHRIESNGLVFGVSPQPDYPVRDIPIRPGDRFLLYTDGLIEPENAKGESFGDSKLTQVLLDASRCPPSELANRLLTELRAWQPVSMVQQDDITLVGIDVD